MLDMIGSIYVIEHCMASLDQKYKQEAYQIYVTDIARAVCMSLGAKNVKRYYELIHPPKEETRNAQDIVAEISQKAGLKEVK